MADNPTIKTIKVNNVDYDIKDAKARADIAALIGSSDATSTIDSFNEVVDFLAGVTNTDTLTGKLSTLETGKVSSVDWNTSGTNGKITYKKSSSGSSTDVVEVEGSATSGSKKPISSGALYTVLNNMTVTAGTGDNADKITIQLKNGTSATVLTTHQDISGKEDKRIELMSWLNDNFGIDIFDGDDFPRTEADARYLTEDEQAALDTVNLDINSPQHWRMLRLPVECMSGGNRNTNRWTGVFNSPTFGGIVSLDIALNATSELKYWFSMTTSTIATQDGLATVATSGSYNDLSNKPTIPDELADLTADSTHRVVTDAQISAWNAKYDKPNDGIPSTHMTSAVQTSLGKADSAIQGVKVNGSALTPDSNKVVDVTVPVVVNNLTTTTAGSALDATQGKALSDALDDKVDKVSGKGLSTNDYTTTEKNKLAGIAAGAEVNVQADWNQTTTTADDYIKNKPTNLNQFTNGPGYQTSANVNSTLADVYDGYDSTTETISFTFPTVS